MIDPKEPQWSDVVHNIAEQRFELRVGEDLSVIDYSLVPGKLVIYHTEVPPQLRGRGIAARITRAALDFARSENLQVEPRCSYAAAFIQKHVEYSDLLAKT